MKPLYDQATIWATLRRGVDNGYWTVDDLDKPPPGYAGDPANYVNLLRPRIEPSPEPEPGVELDGVTIITNATDDSNLPF